jgi:hypothetical protein
MVQQHDERNAIICGFLFFRFRITRAIHESTLEELERRRASEPGTGASRRRSSEE